MNNYNNFGEIDEINSQLERAEIQKKRLIRSIYKEYELYLSFVRDLLWVSVEKGFNELCSYQSIKDNFINANEYVDLFNEKISKLIYMKLPFLTVEQLKVNKTDKNINKLIYFSNLGLSTKINDDQKEKFQYEDYSQLEEAVQFQISEDISNTSEYYQPQNHEKFLSLDLDKNYHIDSLSSNHIIENIGLEKQFITALLELMEEVKFEKPTDFENYNINPIDISLESQNLKNFDLIDKSLENLLLNLSYKINQELFKANLIKRMISQDSFEYLVGKKLMIKHPHPFIINFELNIKQSLSNGEKLSSIILFNISTVELEFKNLNLSIQRNKINELKNQFQGLIKKERYWRKKEITLNKILKK